MIRLNIPTRWNTKETHAVYMCSGCGLRADLQRPAPVGQHLQCHRGQLHIDGWEVRLFSR